MSACPAWVSALSLTSTGTYVSSPVSASIRYRVFSEEPEPSSTRVRAPVAAAISPARAIRISRSARVG
jgi:hypothetical protein